MLIDNFVVYVYAKDVLLWFIIYIVVAYSKQALRSFIYIDILILQFVSFCYIHVFLLFNYFVCSIFSLIVLMVLQVM